MLSLSEKGVFRLHSLEVLPAEAKSKRGSGHASSQMDAIRDMLQKAPAGSLQFSPSKSEILV